MLGVIAANRRRGGGGPPPGPTDPHFASTVLLLSCDGVDGSTIFTDESAAARGNGSAAGNAQVDTSFKKFGTGSAQFDGSGDNIQFTDSADWHFTGDFTIECWFATNNTGADQGLIAQWGGRSFQLQYSGGGTDDLVFAVSSTGSDTVILLQPAFSPTPATFYHVVVEREGNVFSIGVGGTRLATTTNSIVLNNSTGGLTLGSVASATFLNGNLDEVRITKGVARYGLAASGSYTTPTAAFPRS